ncbi:MAG: WD40/YVTN/BNR-like repeat-containing protein [Chthoniobacterales bacterium]
MRKPAVLSGFFSVRMIVGLMLGVTGTYLALMTFAANPTSGTITTSSTPVAWDGTAAAGASATGEMTCVEQMGVQVNCDTYTLTVIGTAADWAGKQINVTISWVVLASDYDLYVHKGSNAGPLIGKSTGSAPGTNEMVAIQPADLDASGSTVFTAHVVYSAAAAGDQYHGTASVATTAGGPTPTPVPVTKSKNWTINYHGECCEGNLAAAGENTYLLLPVLVQGNKIKKSSDGGKTWRQTYPPAPISFPFGIEGDMQAFGDDAIFFGTELADAVVAHSDDKGETWTTVQNPIASAGNDQAWAYLGPFGNMRPGGALPLDEPYVMAGWMRIGTSLNFSFDGGRTFSFQSVLVGNDGSGPDHVVCRQNAVDPPNPDPGDTRIANQLFANQKAGRYGAWGTDGKFYWSETAGGNTLYTCQTNDFGVNWTGNKHALSPGPGSDFVVTHSAFDNNGTLYVLHGNKL